MISYTPTPKEEKSWGAQKKQEGTRQGGARMKASVLEQERNEVLWEKTDDCVVMTKLWRRGRGVRGIP